MVKTYKKGSDIQLSTHFHLREFDCHCTRHECDETLVDTDLVDALEALRADDGVAISIDDGFRCEAHNFDVGGKPHSQHPEGKAADIRTNLGPARTADSAERVPAFANGGIGRYRTFTHVDVRGSKARWNG